MRDPSRRHASMNPCILVFGLPRSGTTWIGKLFDSHPHTLYRHEPDSVRRLHLPLYPERQTAPRYRAEVERFITALPGMRSPEIVGKGPLFRKSYQSVAGLYAYRAGVIAAKAANRIWRHCPCVARPTGRGSGDVRIVWKSIESMGRLGAIVDAVPDARAVCLVRHPCGYVASQLRGWARKRFSHPGYDPDNPWVLNRLLETEAGRVYRSRLGDLKHLGHDEFLAWRWVLTHEKVVAEVANNPRVLIVRYEDVCAQPLQMTRKMLEFAGLPWQLQTEMFVHASTQTSPAWRHKGYYSIFKSPRAAAESWRSELEPDVVARIMDIVGSSPIARFYDRCAVASNRLPEPVVQENGR